jgi:protein-tyrosine phosphatase
VPEPASAAQEAFSIAFVCTGNRFRSPITEAMIRSRVLDVPLTTVSVGRNDARPGPALPEAMEVAHELGLDLAGHRARALVPRELKGFDLVLGFERAHVAEAIRLGGAPRDRAFTLMEFADLLSEIGPIRSTDPLERARLAVTRAHDHRRLVRKYGMAVDLMDPIGQTIGAYRNSAAQIGRLMDRLIAGLFGKQPASQHAQGASSTPFWQGA